MKINHKLLVISFFIVMMIGTTTSGAFSSAAYAGGSNHKNNNEKVKLNCKDVGFALVTLALAYPHLNEGDKSAVDDSLEEGEIARNVG